MKVLGAIVGAGVHVARATLGVACLLIAAPSFAQTPAIPKDTAAGALPWKTGASDAASSAATAAKAARKAADEAKAAAAEAKAAAKPAVAVTPPSIPVPAQAQAPDPAATGKAAAQLSNAPAQATAPPAATTTGSLSPPADPGAKAADKTAADANAISAKIVLTPAKKLFGAAKTAAALPPRAIGAYSKGCVAGAKSLDVDGPAWQAMRLSRNRNWGHPKLIALVERFATEMKTQENWPGLLIGDISQPRGGPMLTGHKSHQLGLDADIWFKPKPASILTRAERETTEPLLLAQDKGTDVIAANWNEGFVRLVKRAASYPEVERIFVHPAIKKEFCKAAGTDRAWLLKVRPIWLHNYHFHIRMACPAGSPSCAAQKPPPMDNDGCGKELTDWLAMVSAPPKPAPVPAPAPAPSAPPPQMNLTQLPVECRTVLTAGEAKDGPAHKAIAEIAIAQAAAVAEKTAKAKLKAAAKDKIKAANKAVSGIQ